MKMIIMAAMFVASTGTSFAEGDTDARDRAIEAMPEGVAAQGEVLANKGYCYTCHGDQGKPLTQNAPSLAGFNSEWIYSILVNYKYGLFNIDNKSKVMEAVVQPMSNQDMSDLAAYYSQFKRDPGAGKVPAPKKLNKCNKCHEDDEDVPSIAGQSAFYIERQLRAYHAKTRHTEDGNSMFKAAKKLKPARIKALADYYADQ